MSKAVLRNLPPLRPKLRLSYKKATRSLEAFSSLRNINPFCLWVFYKAETAQNQASTIFSDFLVSALVDLQLRSSFALQKCCVQSLYTDISSIFKRLDLFHRILHSPRSYFHDFICSSLGLLSLSFYAIYQNLLYTLGFARMQTQNSPPYAHLCTIQELQGCVLLSSNDAQNLTRAGSHLRPVPLSTVISPHVKFSSLEVLSCDLLSIVVHSRG